MIAAFKARQRKTIDRVKGELRVWIRAQHGDDVFSDPSAFTGHARYATEVTYALLETAIDREIGLLGEDDARSLILSVFERRAAALRERC